MLIMRTWNCIGLLCFRETIWTDAVDRWLSLGLSVSLITWCFGFKPCWVLLMGWVLLGGCFTGLGKGWVGSKNLGLVTWPWPMFWPQTNNVTWTSLISSWRRRASETAKRGDWNRENIILLTSLTTRHQIACRVGHRKSGQYSKDLHNFDGLAISASPQCTCAVAVTAYHSVTCPYMYIITALNSLRLTSITLTMSTVNTTVPNSTLSQLYSTWCG